MICGHCNKPLFGLSCASRFNSVKYLFYFSIYYSSRFLILLDMIVSEVLTGVISSVYVNDDHLIVSVSDSIEICLKKWCVPVAQYIFCQCGLAESCCTWLNDIARSIQTAPRRHNYCFQSKFVFSKPKEGLIVAVSIWIFTIVINAMLCGLNTSHNWSPARSRLCSEALSRRMHCG